MHNEIKTVAGYKTNKALSFIFVRIVVERVSFLVIFATSEHSLHYDATFVLEQGRGSVNDTDKLE